MLLLSAQPIQSCLLGQGFEYCTEMAVEQVLSELLAWLPSNHHHQGPI